MKDFGYDISDFMDIDPIFGTMKDFEELLAELHKRGKSVILGFMPLVHKNLFQCCLPVSVYCTRIVSSTLMLTVEKAAVLKIYHTENIIGINIE